MNLTEHLLTCLAEECAEVQQAVSKALRFGMDDGRPESQTTNAQDIARELVDVLAIVEMLEEAGVITLPKNKEARIIQKKIRVVDCMKYAKARGVLHGNVKGGSA